MSALGFATAGLAARTEPVTPLASARRPLAAVMINGRGPFRFVFDSAATRSAVSGKLQYALGLPLAAGASATVNGTLGRERQSLVHVDHLQCGSLSLHDQDLPLLDRYAMPLDDGLLGTAGLKDHCVVIDIDQLTAQVLESTAPQATPTAHRVDLVPHSSGLSMVDLQVAGIHCMAILDTGAERSIGNGAMRRALQLSANESQTLLHDANGQTETAALLPVPACRIGPLSMPAGPMAFNDVKIFSMLGLVTRPALLLGMDRLSAFGGLALDYRQASMRITTR